LTGDGRGSKLHQAGHSVGVERPGYFSISSFAREILSFPSRGSLFSDDSTPLKSGIILVSVEVSLPMRASPKLICPQHQASHALKPLDRHLADALPEAAMDGY
jgi:hypothetical protein